MVDGLSIALRKKVCISSQWNSRESDYLLRDAPEVVIECYILLLQYGQDTVRIISVQLAVAVVCNTKYVLQTRTCSSVVEKLIALHVNKPFSTVFTPTYY
jgi:hypothetical protein